MLYTGNIRKIALYHASNASCPSVVFEVLFESASLLTFLFNPYQNRFWEYLNSMGGRGMCAKMPSPKKSLLLGGFISSSH